MCEGIGFTNYDLRFTIYPARTESHLEIYALVILRVLSVFVVYFSLRALRLLFFANSAVKKIQTAKDAKDFRKGR